MAKIGNQGDGGGIKPRVLTPQEIKEVETLAAVLNQAQVADYFGISQDTFQRILKRQPEVMRSYKNGKSKAIGSIGSSLMQQAKSGNVSAAIFYLKTQAGWKETVHVDNTSSDGSMSPSLDASKLSKSALQEIMDLHDTKTK